MSGNVHEVVASFYYDYPYFDEDTPENLAGDTDDPFVIRGGSFTSSADHQLRTTTRSYPNDTTRPPQHNWVKVCTQFFRFSFTIVLSCYSR
jgi:hypothetical protein